MDIFVYIEISKNSNVKYEFNKELNSLVCDRILSAPFIFPFNYGFIPNTLSGDGDPLDAIVYMEEELIPGTYIKCKIIGCLETTDEKGDDKKLILVPSNNVYPLTADINSINDLPLHFLNKVIYFYSHYKELEFKKVSVGELLDRDQALIIYNNSII